MREASSETLKLPEPLLTEFDWAPQLAPGSGRESTSMTVMVPGCSPTYSPMGTEEGGRNYSTDLVKLDSGFRVHSSSSSQFNVATMQLLCPCVVSKWIRFEP